MKKQEMGGESESKLEKYQIKIDTEVVPNEEDPFQIIIPNNKKPYINKDINFKLFIEVLTEEADQMRVCLNQEDFCKIQIFSSLGLPTIVIKMYQFLTRRSFKEI